LTCPAIRNLKIIIIIIIIINDDYYFTAADVNISKERCGAFPRYSAA
jgi:hypothetical protein